MAASRQASKRIMWIYAITGSVLWGWWALARIKPELHLPIGPEDIQPYIQFGVALLLSPFGLVFAVVELVKKQDADIKDKERVIREKDEVINNKDREIAELQTPRISVHEDPASPASIGASMLNRIIIKNSRTASNPETVTVKMATGILGSPTPHQFPVTLLMKDDRSSPLKQSFVLQRGEKQEIDVLQDEPDHVNVPDYRIQRRITVPCTLRDDGIAPLLREPPQSGATFFIVIRDALYPFRYWRDERGILRIAKQ